tara:strand:+ start:260 stop:1156 length:897 start_codon:yes stop_codon:yes gene_type:complete
MIIYLFGATTPTGLAFERLCKEKFPNIKLVSLSRKHKKSNFVDLDDFNTFRPKSKEKFFIVSFSPIWKFTSFLDSIFLKKSYILKNLNGIITCSSSSIYTKRFAFNKFDKKLYQNLNNSESKLIKLSQTLKFSLCILEPTLIYGNVGPYKDNNINLILSLMRLFPFLIIPSRSGLRQPIHCSQLASVAIKKIEDFLNSSKENFSKLAIGGDKIINFEEMLCLIQRKYSQKNKLSRCFIVKIPNRIFYFALSPIVILSPKLYESLLRINADLSGFIKVSNILKTKEKDFPLQNDKLLNN